MRHTLFSIYNKIALDISDIEFKKITKQEYLTAAGECAYEISKQSKAFIEEKSITVPVGGTNALLIRSNHGLFADIDQAYPEIDEVFDNSGNVPPYDKMYFADRLMKYRIRLPKKSFRAAVSTHLYYDFYIGDFFKPIYILKTIRFNADCREYSWEAIDAAYRGNNPFKVNDSPLDYRAYAIRKLPNDAHPYPYKDILRRSDTEQLELMKKSETMMLYFATPLEVDEVIKIHFVNQMPIHSELNAKSDYNTQNYNIEWVPFEDNTIIPDFMETCFYKCLRKAIIEKLVFREGDMWTNRLTIAKMEADNALRGLKEYIANLKDMSSFPQIQPLKWLSDGNVEHEHIDGGNGIPDYYHTNIIV